MSAYRKSVFLALMAALLSLAMFPGGSAQAQNTGLKVSQSSGLSASLIDIIATPHEITAQFMITNDTKARIYIIDARADESQRAFLGSGPHLDFPNLAGLPYCNNSASNCINNRDDMALDRFSYIEPGGQIGTAIKYNANAPFPDKETISFSLALVAKFAKPDADPSEVGPAKAIRFSFPFVSFTKR